jgi:methionyl-tRNA formyltransferase
VSQPFTPLRTCYFGDSHEDASARGLAIALAQPGIDVVSVTGGRGESYAQDGLLQRVARSAGIPLLNLQGVRREVGAADLVISFYNPVIFPADFIEQVRWGVLNVHPGPLPEYRGCHPVEHAVLDGAAEFGATLHLCDSGIDTGPVIDEERIHEERIPVTTLDTARTLWSKVDDLAVLLLKRTLPRVVEAARDGHRVPALAQDSTRAQYFKASLPRECRLDLAGGLESLVRQVRAYDHRRWEPAFVESDGYRIYFRYRDGHVVMDRVDAQDQLSRERELALASRRFGVKDIVS